MFTRLLHTIQSHIMSKEPEPGPGPGPSFDYLILNQFIDPMPTPVPRQYIVGDFTNEVPSDFNDQWVYQKDDLVSDTVGSQFLDSDSPIDFTSKGISIGTPFGLIYEHDGLYAETGIGYSIQQGGLAGDFTVETWYKNYEMWFFGLIKLAGPLNEYGYATLPSIIIELSNDTELILDFDDGDSVRFQLEYTLEPQWNDGNWHHYALSYDSTAQAFYLFYDGKKIVTIDSTNEHFSSLKNALDTVAVVEAGYTVGDGYFPSGRFAQFAVCQQCKWNSDFTPSTTAYT